LSVYYSGVREDPSDIEEISSPKIEEAVFIDDVYIISPKEAIREYSVRGLS
jgi:hypothetical protein